MLRPGNAHKEAAVAGRLRRAAERARGALARTVEDGDLGAGWAAARLCDLEGRVRRAVGPLAEALAAVWTRALLAVGVVAVGADRGRPLEAADASYLDDLARAPLAAATAGIVAGLEGWPGEARAAARVWVEDLLRRVARIPVEAPEPPWLGRLRAAAPEGEAALRAALAAEIVRGSNWTLEGLADGLRAFEPALRVEARIRADGVLRGLLAQVALVPALRAASGPSAA